jgi:uncharacterized membrane protein YfcA
VTLSSVGAGAIGVTALVLLFPMLATTRIVGNGYRARGADHAARRVRPRSLRQRELVAPREPPPRLPARDLLGSHLTSRIPERVLRVSLVAVLLFAGTKLLLH